MQQNRVQQEQLFRRCLGIAKVSWRWRVGVLGVCPAAKGGSSLLCLLSSCGTWWMLRFAGQGKVEEE